MPRRRKSSPDVPGGLGKRLFLNARESAEEFKQEVASASLESLEISFRIRGAAASTVAAFARCFARFGLNSGARVALLQKLHFAGGRLTQIELGRLMGITAPSVSYLVDGLEKDDLITRTPDPQNRRATFVELTDSGESLCQTIVPEAARFTELLCQDFTDEELQVFNQYLERLQNRAMSLFLPEQ